MKRILAILLLFHMLVAVASAQELNCKVKVIHSQIQGSSTSIFETLETAITEFMNNRAWTEMQFQQAELIDCTMNITLTGWNESEAKFTGEILFQLSRPVFGSTYNTIVFSRKDADLEFTYREYDPLEWNENNIDNNLTAVLAYYAYLFIGMDLDTFSPLGGTDVLHICENIANNAQSLGAQGWDAFKDSKNRHAIINDYMESSMEPFRQLMYKYHHQGLDEMVNNIDRARVAVTEAIELLDEAHHNKPMSMIPQIFTDYKRDEIVGIYTGHGTDKEKTSVRETCSNINASQNSYWNKIK